MSKTKSTDELHSHKKQALQNVEDYLNKLIASEDSHDNGKADKLCYWLKDWMTFLDFEKSFSPMSLRRYKRGEIVKVHLGFNVGSEEGGLHYAVVLDKNNANWIGLYDSGRKLLDQVVVPAGILKANQSYARVSDADNQWEVKDDSAEKYVTPSTNNKTIESNPKMDKFEQHDPAGIGMAISAMSVVFLGLILLYICFKFIGKTAIVLRKRNAMKAHNITDKQEAKEKGLGEAPGEIIAAISMALHEAQGADHDVEETILTISRVKRSYSPWSSKIYTLRETPHKK